MSWSADTIYCVYAIPPVCHDQRIQSIVCMLYHQYVMISGYNLLCVCCIPPVCHDQRIQSIVCMLYHQYVMISGYNLLCVCYTTSMSWSADTIYCVYAIPPVCHDQRIQSIVCMLYHQYVMISGYNVLCVCCIPTSLCQQIQFGFGKIWKENWIDWLLRRRPLFSETTRYLSKIRCQNWVCHTYWLNLCSLKMTSFSCSFYCGISSYREEKKNERKEYIHETTALQNTKRKREREREREKEREREREKERERKRESERKRAREKERQGQTDKDIQTEREREGRGRKRKRERERERERDGAKIVMINLIKVVTW